MRKEGRRDLSIGFRALVVAVKARDRRLGKLGHLGAIFTQGAPFVRLHGRHELKHGWHGTPEVPTQEDETGAESKSAVGRQMNRYARILYQIESKRESGEERGQEKNRVT